MSIKTEGNHTLRWWSLDNAGNSEEPKTLDDLDRQDAAHDRPHTGAACERERLEQRDVTVTFTCADALSGIADCTSPQTVDEEGQSQSVTGTALDNAGNTATDPATVSLDETQPTISAVADGSPTADGWYNHSVAPVSFTVPDDASPASTPAPRRRRSARVPASRRPAPQSTRRATA